MTTRLQEALTELAGDARPPATAGLWVQGRRRRRRRRWTAGGLALIALAAVAGPALLVRPGPPAAVPGDGGGPAVPRRFEPARPWQELAERDPNGPVMLTFVNVQGRLSLPARPVTVIGQDGSFRGSARLGRLSPDGRFLAQPDRIVDLSTNAVVPIDASFGSVADWSPDGRQLLMTSPTGATVVEAATGHGERLGVGSPSGGAFSPDGRRVALAESDQVTVVDAATGDAAARVPYGAWQRFAGWDATGGRLIFLVAEQCPWSECGRDATSRDSALALLARQRWHLRFVDVATGAATDESRTGRSGWPDRLIGWHDGAAIWIVDGRTIQAVRPGEPAAVLAEGPSRAEQLDVARDLVVAGRFGGPDLDAPLTPLREEWRWLLAVVATLVAVAGLAVAVRRRPLTGRRRTPPHPT
ncbi:TolB family protein [Dactylosporangium sucinum]|uniref:Uncharacterized protein n=1 Tax=Dactylosporangium sucinum TaxID=1424081 RepID=A0A917T010_9ACTN|nr:hypothetical protein [Dactylosporangium sucinum]GGM05533.1 hypothetical protein GCM10007977_003320 [Dactylosporangium sucinum]